MNCLIIQANSDDPAITILSKRGANLKQSSMREQQKFIASLVSSKGTSAFTQGITREGSYYGDSVADTFNPLDGVYIWCQPLPVEMDLKSRYLIFAV